MRLALLMLHRARDTPTWQHPPNVWQWRIVFGSFNPCQILPPRSSFLSSGRFI
jgi:hypothetical protein